MGVVLTVINEMGLDMTGVGLHVHIMRIRIQQKNKLYPDFVAFNHGLLQKYVAIFDYCTGLFSTM